MTLILKRVIERIVISCYVFILFIFALIGFFTTMSAWDKILATNPDAIPEPEIDGLFGLIDDLNVDRETDPARLRQLFQVAWALQRERDRQQEEFIEDLKRDLRDAERRAGAASGGPDEAYDQIRDLETNVEKLSSENMDLRKLLDDEKLEKEAAANKVIQLTAENATLREDLASADNNIRDLQRQLDAQRDRMTTRKGEDLESRERDAKVRREFRQMNAYIDELEAANKKLREEQLKMKVDLEEATKLMDKTTEERVRIKAEQSRAEITAEKLTRENTALRQQVADLHEQVGAKGEADDQIMVELNNKVEEWKVRLISSSSLLSIIFVKLNHSYSISFACVLIEHIGREGRESARVPPGEPAAEAAGRREPHGLGARVASGAVCRSRGARPPDRCAQATALRRHSADGGRVAAASDASRPIRIEYIYR